jgi:phage tail sheath gpL-like
VTITFDQIPADWRVPGVYVEIAPDYGTLGVLAWPAKLLVIGQRLPTGSADDLALVQCTTAAAAAAAFGAGSLLEAQIAALRRANQTQDVWGIALPDDAAGVAATATVTLAGSPSRTAPLVIYIGGRRVRVAASAGETAAVVAARLAAAVNAAGLIVSAAASGAVVTLTLRHKGDFGNDLSLLPGTDDEAPPAGLTVTAGAFRDGAANPDLSAVWDVIGDEWFTDIVVPYADNANLASTDGWLEARYGAMGPRDAHAYLGWSGSFGALSAKGALRNSAFMSVIGAYGSPTPGWEWAAALAGRASFCLTNDPARHLRTISLPGIAAPPVEKRFTALEQDLLLRDGVSTWSVTSDGTVVLERVITCYQKAATGFDDPSWLDIVTPKTLSRIRYDWRAYLSLNYPRHKLADDGSPAAASGPVMTPKLMHGVWAGRCAKYEELGWIEGAAETVRDSRFERDRSDRNRLNSRQKLRIIGQLMVIAGRLEFQV